MRKNDIYKKIVLGILFVFPLLVYLFFASGKNNFAKLPILTTSIDELPENLIGSTPQLKEHITILGYWGGSLENKKSWSPQSEWKDLQAILPIWRLSVCTTSWFQPRESGWRTKKRFERGSGNRLVSVEFCVYHNRGDQNPFQIP